MQQVAMRSMQLEGVDAQRVGALGGPHEGLLDARQAGGIERDRRRIALRVRQRRWRRGRPAAFVGAQRLAAAPGHVARCLAPGVAELHGDRHAGVATHGRQPARQRGLVVVRVEAEVGRRDAAFGLDRGGLDDEQPGARHGQLAQVHQVPVAGIAVLDGVLAHRRDDDAVGQRQRAEGEGIEEMSHERTRTMPSCAIDATSLPSRVNMLPRLRPRPPPALGESMV